MVQAPIGNKAIFDRHP